MKDIKSILLALLCLFGGALSQRLIAQDIDVTIDWGDWWPEPAQMINPRNGATLTSSTVTFQWTAGNLVSQYWLRIGTTSGGRNLVEQSMGLATSATVTQLPINGNPIYVTLFSAVSGQWQSYSYVYSTAGSTGQATAARMVSPADGSTLAAGSVTFQWSAVAEAQQYWLYIGTSKDGYDLFNSSTGSATFAVVPNLPRNGKPIFVKLWTKTPGQWLANYYQYTAASNSGTGTGSNGTGNGSNGTGTGNTGTDRMLRFDGVDDLVLIPINASETSYTVNIWFRTTKPDGGIFSATDAGGGSHDRHIYLSQGNLCSRVWANETIATSGRNYADGNWHQVTHLFGGNMGAQKLFVDGVLAASGTLTQSVFSWQTHIRVGYSADKGFFQGDIYDVRLWDAALSAEDIAAQVKYPPNVNHPNLAGYWMFDEDPASNEVLNSAPRNHSIKGTLGGNSQVAADDPQRVIYQGASDAGAGNSGNNSGGTANLALGLVYEYYELGSALHYLPNFSQLPPAKTAIVPNFDISPRSRNDQFAFRFTGSIKTETAGTYTFFTSSDDGSQLFIDGELVVNNDGLHSLSEQSGTRDLTVGHHQIVVTYYEAGGPDEKLEVTWAGPGFAKQPIPNNRLFH